MRRRTFIESLVAFAGVFAFTSKLEFSWTFPFARRRPLIPQWVATTTATGEMSITLPIPNAQKDDVLVAAIASYSPDGPVSQPKHVPGWTWFGAREQGEYVQDSWYIKTDRDLHGQSVTFSRKGATRMAGTLSVIRGADIEQA